MSRIESIEDIDSIKVHWSESSLINEELGCDDDGDIDKWVTPEEMHILIQKAGKLVGSGFDKTSMTIKLKTGDLWANNSKFYIANGDNCLLNVLNKGM